MMSTINCYWFLIFATFLGCSQLIPVQKQNLKSELGIAEDFRRNEFLTEKRSPKIPENIQLLSNDERSTAISPHMPVHIQKRNSEEKIALNVRPYSGSTIKETAAEQNFRSTKKSGQTPPQANAPDHGSRKKRQFNCNYLLACNFSLSPHLWPMAEFFPNNGGILHPVNYRG